MWPVSVSYADIHLKVLLGSNVVQKVLIPATKRWIRTRYLSKEVSHCCLLHILFSLLFGSFSLTETFSLFL
jgi:hypothetical protein